MALEKCNCPACGGNDLKEIADKKYRCDFCGTTFKEKEVEVSQKLVDLVRAKLDGQKLENYSNAKANLWQSAHKEFLSNEEIKHWANEVKKYAPDDFLSDFYLTATFGSVDEICDYLVKYLKGGDFFFADEVVRYLLKTAESERLIQPTVAILDSADLGDKYDEYKNALNDLSQKLNNGMFITSLSRDVFVAYSSKDIGIVTELVDEIEKNGFTCFCAQRNLRHGKGAKENYAEELKTAMHNSKCVLFVSSENSRRIDCDAFKIEIPYYKNHEKDKGRIEYVIDKEKYSLTLPFVKNELKNFFDGQEFCTNKEDLLGRIFEKVSGFSTEPKKEEENKNNALEEQFKKQEEQFKKQEELLKKLIEENASSSSNKTKAAESSGTGIKPLLERAEIKRSDEKEQNEKVEINKKKFGAKYKKKWVAILLCLFLGWLGVHKFYEGKIFWGIVYFFTHGLFVVGVIVDLLSLLFKPKVYVVK